MSGRRKALLVAPVSWLVYKDVKEGRGELNFSVADAETLIEWSRDERQAMAEAPAE